jgi:hypothetical protein
MSPDDQVAIDYALEHGMHADAVRGAQLTHLLEGAQLEALGEGEVKSQVRTHFLLMRGRLLDDLANMLGVRPKTMVGNFVCRFGDRFIVWPVMTHENVVHAYVPHRGLWLTVTRLSPRAPYPHEVAVLSDQGG